VVREDRLGQIVEDINPPAVLAELPERSRLLHIGLMKTGTTAVQRAANARRPMLLRYGVRYPGTLYNHRQSALALMNRGPRSVRGERASDAWDELLDEIGQEADRKIWISNEFICGCDDQTAARFLTDLGARTHVIVTLRSVAATLPSLWQQYVKTGTTDDFEEWLDIVLNHPPGHPRWPAHFSRNDQGAVVSRWARLAGPENVTVVIGDKADPRRIPSTFETLLALPPGTLDPPRGRGFDTNRSFSAEEVSLFLKINQALPCGKMTEDELTRILRGGSMARVLNERPPPSSDTALALPAWAARRAGELGGRYAEVIAGTGVRVVGDLTELSLTATPAGRYTMPDLIPVDLAAQAVIGAMSGQLHRGSDFRRPLPEHVRPPRLLRTIARRLRLPVRRLQTMVSRSAKF